jgi:hypothetical protein
MPLFLLVPKFLGVLFHGHIVILDATRPKRVEEGVRSRDLEEIRGGVDPHHHHGAPRTVDIVLRYLVVGSVR